MTMYNIYEARDSLSRIIAESERGEDVVIAKRGRPVVRVVPVEDSTPPMTCARFAQWLSDDPLPARLRTPSEEIAERIRENRASWE